MSVMQHAHQIEKKQAVRLASRVLKKAQVSLHPSQEIRFTSLQPGNVNVEGGENAKENQTYHRVNWT